jgi:hypothetical protein
MTRRPLGGDPRQQSDRAAFWSARRIYFLKGDTQLPLSNDKLRRRLEHALHLTPQSP